MHPFCAALRTHRWLADDQKIKKIPSECFSLTCYETITENITTSNQRQESYHKEPMRIQTKNKEIARSAEKREGTERKKTKQSKKPPQKNQFLALQLTIFNRPLLHLTHSPVPSTVNEEFLKKNVIYRNISPVKRKVEYSLNTLWVLGMMSCAGWVTCPVLGSWCHGDANSCARSLSISVPRSLMMVITGAAFRLTREQKKAFRRYSVCWLCKSSRLFSWIKKIKNCCEQRLMF